MRSRASKMADADAPATRLISEPRNLSEIAKMINGTKASKIPMTTSNGCFQKAYFRWIPLQAFASTSNGWHIQFLESDLKMPLPRKLTFADPEKIRELARRGEAWGDSESRQMLEHAIEVGRGRIYLRLTREHYRKLR
jgi:hypothetical protein